MTDDSHDICEYARLGSQDAFKALVDRHVNLVYRTALRQTAGNTHMAEEATQAVFILLAKKVGGLTGHVNLAGWLYTATGNVVGNMRRAEWRRKIHEQEAAMNESVNGGTTETEWESVRPELDIALGLLGEKERAAIVLRFFEGKAFGEVGAVLNLSEDAARMRTGRALEKLRGLLVKKGVTSSVAALGVMLAAEGAQAAPAGLAPMVASAALAGGSSSVAIGFLGFMSTAKATIGAATAAAFMLAGLVYEWRDTAAANARNVAAQQEYGRVETRLKKQEAEIGVQTRAIDALKNSAAGKQAVANSSAKPALDPVERGRRLMEAYPEVKKEFKARQRAMTADRYYALYNELHLSDAQIAAFEEIVGSKAAAYTCSIDGVEITLKLDEALSKDEIKARLIALLGDDGYQRYKNYDAYNSDVQEVAAALYYTDEPLTAEQGRRLMQAMQVENRRVKKGVTTVADYLGGLDASAKEFMSETQLAGLQQLRARYELWWAQDQYAQTARQK